jgi:glycosyltransferase involved in cell wall biosynthesis
MTKEIQLSICIATHNRSIFLKEAISSFIPQLNDEIEIIIVDGASTDDTKLIVENFSTINSSIKYLYLNEKGGIDKDYDIALQNANGKFCWLFSDDDICKPGILDLLLKLIKQDVYSLILVNAELYNFNLDTKFKNTALNFDSDRVYDIDKQSQVNFFEDCTDYLSFIGCVVIDKKLWLSRNREKYYGTEFIHVGVIFQEFLPKKVYIVSNPFIRIRLNNAQWVKRSISLWILNWPKLVWSFLNFNSNSKTKIIAKESLSQYRRLLYFRAIGLFNAKFHKEVKDLTNPSFPVYLISYIISILNIKLCNLFYRFYAKILNKPWMLIELKKYS